MSTEAPISPMTADATPRRKAATFASLTFDLRWRRPLFHKTGFPPEALTARPALGARRA